MDMHLGCSTLVVGHLPLASALRRIRELGYHACDIFAFAGSPHLDPVRLAAGDMEHRQELTQTLAETGLRVSGVNAAFTCQPTEPGGRAQMLQEFRALLAVTRDFGCPHITVQPGAGSLPDAEDGLRALTQANGDSGICLAFEPHQGSVAELPTDALRLVERLWPAVGITYDPSHFAMQDIPLPLTTPLLRYTTHLHLRNAAVGRMSVPMHEGQVDFSWVIAALRYQGYQDAVVIEYLDSDEESAAILRDLLHELGVDDG